MWHRDWWKPWYLKENTKMNNKTNKLVSSKMPHHTLTLNFYLTLGFISVESRLVLREWLREESTLVRNRLSFDLTLRKFSYELETTRYNEFTNEKSTQRTLTRTNRHKTNLQSSKSLLACQLAFVPIKRN